MYTLKCATLRFGKLQTWPRHFSDQWPTAGSGHRWWPLCFHEFTSSLEHWTWVLIPLSQQYFVVRGLICGITYALFILVTYKHIYSFPWYYISVTWSHAGKLYWCNLTEWARSIYPSLGWTNPVLDACLNILLWNTWNTPLWSPCYGVTVDAI